ncbi:MAG: adenine deaminase C-terminal domain-containing protein [Desulfatiglandales bacterium]
MKRRSLLSIEGLEKAKEVMAVSLGKEKADLAVLHGTLLNVYTGEFIEDCAVLAKGEWIAYVGDAPEESIGPDTEILDAGGRPVIPGLIDGHAHLADGLCSPVEVLRYVMAGGTTTIITETVEPYPLRGCEGITDFLEAFRDQPVKIFATAPAMASTSRRSHGISSYSLQQLFSRDEVIGLGESYWQAVIQDPDTFLPNFRTTLLGGRKLEGHSAGAKGRSLTAYIATGVSSCHEPITAQEALERLRLGLHVMVREGSIRRDLEAISQIRAAGIDLRRLILVTDGVEPGDLLEKGYMEYVVQKAVDLGFDPVTAIQMATINVAEYFGLDGIVGGLAPARYADLLILPDPRTIRPEVVISRGRIIARDGKPLQSPRSHHFSPQSLKSIHLDKRFEASDFAVRVEDPWSHVNVRVIEQIAPLVTRECVTCLPVVEGLIRPDPGQDLLKVAAIDRSIETGKTFVGLIKGFGLAEGAVASSSAWDTSDIIVVGVKEEDMAEAVNRIQDLQGGVVFCSGGRILAEIPLPILGLMSDLPLPLLAEKSGEMTRVMKEKGFPFDDPLRTLSTLTGAAIPFLRICEEGLVDIKTGKGVPLFWACRD